jgi:hypothetical protein
MSAFREFLNEGKDEAKAIRDILKKEFGLSSRDVSLKTRSGQTSSAVTVSIKTMKALGFLGKIKNLAKDFDKYDFDQASGEILQGGNTFIFTDIDYKFEVQLQDAVDAEFKKQTKGEFSITDQVTLFSTFVIHYFEKDLILVKMANNGGKTNATTNTSTIRGVGSSVMSLIGKQQDDTLYAKIK